MDTRERSKFLTMLLILLFTSPIIGVIIALVNHTKKIKQLWDTLKEVILA